VATLTDIQAGLADGSITAVNAAQFFRGEDPVGSYYSAALGAVGAGVMPALILSMDSIDINSDGTTAIPAGMIGNIKLTLDNQTNVGVVVAIGALTITMESEDIYNLDDQTAIVAGDITTTFTSAVTNGKNLRITYVKY